MNPAGGTSGGGRIKVLYIGGAGRSGSTLLDRLLGQMDGFCSIGEFRYGWRHGFLYDPLCTCGERVRQCPFWGPILGGVFGLAPPEEVVRLSLSVDRMRNIPLLASRGLLPRFQHGLEAYTSLLGRVYRSIQAASGCEVIVDSSKHAIYCYLLSLIEDLDVRVVHLVRDSRAVAYSWQRRRLRPEIWQREQHMELRPPWQSAVEWQFINGLYEGLKRILPGKVLTLRYEDLVARPEMALEGILSFLDVKREPHVQGNTVFLKPGHLVAGNPMRFQTGRLTIKPDAEWQERMSPLHKAVVTTITSPLLMKYGYLPRR